MVIADERLHSVTSPVATPRHRPLIAAALTVCAGAAILAALLWLGAGAGKGAQPPAVASLGDLDPAIASATQGLIGSAGLEGMQVSYLNERLTSATWFTSRPDGSALVISATDMDVATTRSLAEEDRPDASFGITTAAWIRAGDVVEAWTGEGWLEPGRSSATEPPALGLMWLETKPSEFATETTKVTNQARFDGGTIWTLSQADENGSSLTRWEIDSTGVLESISFDLAGTAIGIDTANPFTSGRIDYKAVDEPAPIEPPDTTVPFDGMEFGLPDDFPLGG